MTGGDAVPLLLARLMRLSLARTPLLLVRAAPSASALSVRALRLLRLLGPRPGPLPELAAVSFARRELEDWGWAGLESVTSLAMLMADTCSYQFVSDKRQWQWLACPSKTNCIMDQYSVADTATGAGYGSVDFAADTGTSSLEKLYPSGCCGMQICCLADGLQNMYGPCLQTAHSGVRHLCNS